MNFFVVRDDPPDEVPWAMPIVVRAEKGEEPGAAAVAEACAMAVVQLLDDERSATGEWSADVGRWLDGRIRKVARRARGPRWTAAAAFPGDSAPPNHGWLEIATTPTVAMTPLKTAVQVAHAAQLALTAMSPADLDEWRAVGFGVRLIRPDADQWARWLPSAPVVVRDAGFTEIDPGTRTAIALWF